MDLTATTPPPIQAPTAKEKKYDRQLRLWAANGQRALEESHILLVISDQGETGSGSSVAGVEALKNLVLPGIGSFTIADSAKVTEADLGINFFLEDTSLGKSRAEESKRLLEELNPDVSGHAISTNIEEWLAQPDTLHPFTLIILCAPLPIRARESICSHSQHNSIPLIHLNCTGFFSTFSIQLPSEFPIVDTHPDPDSTQDLRLLTPWHELSSEVSALADLQNLDDHDHGHVPYILLLLYYLEEWKGSHGGKAPGSFKEKTQFREMVRAGARTNNAEGGEENFDEAAGAVLKSINPATVGSGCREMFEMEQCSNLKPNSANFWIIATAIKSFYKGHGELPLPGSLPDMKARSADYVRLQNVYKTKARRDVAEVLDNVRVIENQLRGTTTIPETEVEAFCKNAAHVKIVSGQKLPHTRLSEIKTCSKILSELENDESTIAIFLALVAAESSKSGPLSDAVVEVLSTIASGTVLESLDLQPVMEAAEEVDRARGGEMHNISSLTGGMVAQEAIKLVTRQYVPVDNTCVFDGIKCKTEVFRL